MQSATIETLYSGVTYLLSAFTKYDYTSSKFTFTDTIKWNPHESGSHRLKVVAKIWNGGSVVGKGSDVSGYC